MYHSNLGSASIPAEQLPRKGTPAETLTRITSNSPLILLSIVDSYETLSNACSKVGCEELSSLSSLDLNSFALASSLV